MTRDRLPAGDQGTRKTLAMMQALVRDGARDVSVRETAIGILRAAGVPSHDTLGELTALHDYVRDHVRFTRDIAGVETLQGARYTLHTMSGDCDDRATLLGALAESVGIPARLKFRVIAASRKFPGKFSHVYLVANVNGRDVALDPTYRQTSAGFEFPHPGRVADYQLS